METESEKTILGKIETLKHIHKVREYLCQMIMEIDQRARDHDLSKLESPEKEIFGEHTPELAKYEYGSPEHTEMQKKVLPAQIHHYSKNRHHPEHWPQGINDMTLIDVLEMLCDWKAAGERYKGGNIQESLAHNRERFGLSDQLYAVLENTVKELGW